MNSWFLLWLQYTVHEIFNCVEQRWWCDLQSSFTHWMYWFRFAHHVLNSCTSHSLHSPLLQKVFLGSWLHFFLSFLPANMIDSTRVNLTFDPKMYKKFRSQTTNRCACKSGNQIWCFRISARLASFPGRSRLQFLIASPLRFCILQAIKSCGK